MNYLVQRVLSTIPVLLGVCTLSFFLLHLIPGDPADIILGDQAAAIDKQALRQSMGIDRPLGEQYRRFLYGLLQFDLGRSLLNQKSNTSEILERAPATVQLALAAITIAILFGIPLGVLAAVWPRTLLDRGLLLAASISTSMPSFWLGPMLILLFAIKLDWLPVSEYGGPEYLVLPALTLSFGLTSALIQTTRAAMLEVVAEDYIRVARAKGAGFFQLYFRHALANALIPVLTILGLQLGARLTGAVIIDTIFDWPGIGSLLFQAIQQRNYTLVQACVLFISCTYVLVNLLTDFAYVAANPKVRLQ